MVIGAGAAGLSAAAMLHREGAQVVVLEQEAVGASWRGRYDRLRLNSTRLLSSLPGHTIPRANGRWVHRDDYVAYLERYARHHGLEVRTGVRADRVERDGDRFVVATADGPVRARAVVVATGFDREPYVPPWPGRDGFTGELVHTAAYRRPDPYRGRRVLVVGAGNSAAEIALDVAEGGAAEVLLAVRTPPILLAHEWHGIPVTWFAVAGTLAPAPVRDLGTRVLSRLMFGDLSAYGLPAPQRGMTEQLALGRLPTIDKGTVAAIKRGAIRVVGAVERFDGADVVLAGGARVRPDVVLAGTAYTHALEPLVGHLGAVGDDGTPRHGAVPGLLFAGYHVPLTGLLTQHRRDAPRLARDLAHRLQEA